MHNALLKNNDLLAQLKNQLRATAPRIEGRVKATDKSFGFLETDKGKSYFIAPPHMKKLLPGDRISAVLREEKDKQGQIREQAEPESLLQPGLEHFVARLTRDQRQQWQLVAEGVLPAVTLPTRLPADLPEPVQEGDWVMAQLILHAFRDGKNHFQAQITRKVASKDDPFAPWWVILAQHQLPHEPPAMTENSLPLLDETQGLTRADLTHLPFFTIDSRSTADMDDALHIQPQTEGGWQLHVAIADPSAYLPEGSELDQQARQRGFTLYLPARTISMLPRQLAENQCSLLENEQRPALVARLLVDAQGNLQQPIAFQLAWISSKARLDYQRVSDWLEATGSWQPETPDLTEQLRELARFAETRQQWREQHALVYQDQPDYRFVLDQQGQVLDIVRDPRRIAHKMVEEAMLLANTAGGDFLAQHAAWGLFNSHQGFDSERITQAIKLLQEQGIRFTDTDYTAESLNSLEGFRHLRQQLNRQPNAWLEARLRKYQGLAQLSSQAEPHFGMAVPAYATWTSPIRRYSDLINHRLIKALLAGRQLPLDNQLVADLTQARKLNRLAERDVREWLYARYLQQFIGQKTFAAEILLINRGGLRVRLNDNGAQVFLPLSSLQISKDELSVDVEQGQIHQQGQLRYQLGDTLSVQLTGIDESGRKLIGAPA